MPGHQPIERPVDLVDQAATTTIVNNVPAAAEGHVQPADPEGTRTRLTACMALSLILRDQYENAAISLVDEQLDAAALDRIVEAAAMLGDLATTARSDPRHAAQLADAAVPGA